VNSKNTYLEPRKKKQEPRIKNQDKNISSAASLKPAALGSSQVAAIIWPLAAPLLTSQYSQP
jgi:hypothetical protein